MQIFDHHVIFDEITYDREELKAWYESVRQYRNDYAAVMNTDVGTGLSHNKQFGYRSFQTIDTYAKNGLHIMDYEPIQKLVKQFNFDRPLEGREVDVMIYHPGFHFKPHVDYHMHCGIMFPILPDVGAEPIDFYKLPEGEVWERAKDYEKQIVAERDLLYSYEYSMTHPSMFNGDTIHGVRRVKQERVFLRFKCLSMTFDQVIEKAKAGKFINGSLV